MAIKDQSSDREPHEAPPRDVYEMGRPHLAPGAVLPESVTGITHVVMVPKVKTDKERAAELRAECTEALQNIMKVMDAAKRDGFELSWAIGCSASNVHFLQTIKVVKDF